ncbi:GntR family transcriptional regulator [Nioella ostreopsis]|uniref:GntR family transcriptional regulator n=1 Tax=Nioella ostreopsis TaxID=2448479 RepID=UPI000FD97DFB|nr:GntR family transcriptional regulator [Nioella ostreopsis]
MTASDPKLPEHEAIYKKIRNMILFGEVLPGQGVTILGLKDAVGAGVTPVREAIRRLTAEGALEALGNRRVCVPQLSPQRIDEIYYARFALEPKMAQLAAEKITQEGIILLEALDAKVDQAIATGNIEAYLESNFRFHFALYDMAGTPILRKIVTSLWLQFGPSLRVVSGRFGTSNLPDMHSETIEALRRGDPTAAARAIEDDIQQGLDLMTQALGN